MSDKKLLHERLRDFANLYGYNVSVKFEDYFYLEAYDANKLADEIERYYIPRPRFEDGEPVKEGDEVEGGAAYYIQVMDDCSWKIEDDDGCSLCSGKLEDYVKRDADGVQINIGDIVYCPEGQRDTPFVVIDNAYPSGLIVLEKYECSRFLEVKYPPEALTHKPPVFDADGVPIKKGDVVFNLDDNGKRGIVSLVRKFRQDSNRWLVICVDDDGDIAFKRHPERITHKEPDTQEKIDADKKKCIVDYWNCPDMGCEECHASMYGKNPMEFYETSNCSIAQGLDIARRQAELDAHERED